MNSIKDSALILRRTSFGEADVLLTLLTAEHGKLRVLAKGARKPSSRLVGHIELFSVMSGQINMKSSIPILSQVSVEESIAGLAEDPVALQRISFLAEMVDKALEEGVASEAIYALLVEGSLRMRENYQPMLFVGLVVRLLGLLGYAPELTHCTVCKIKLQAGGRYGWDHAAGGVVADDCLHHHSVKSEPIAGESLKAIRYLQSQPVAKMGLLQTSETVIDSLHHIMINYARYVLEQPLISATISYNNEYLVRS